LAAVPALGHHSAAAKYDASRTLTLNGAVTAFTWRNPHCFLYLDAQTGPYKGRAYVVEMSSAGVLSTEGWSASRLKPGDVVEIRVLPARVAGMAAGLCRDPCKIRVVKVKFVG